MYMPPELQGVSSFRGVLRTRNHDNFGLAVFIFMLLFMGRHPFAGKYSGSGDMPIERAIREFRFAYGTSAAARQMQPPPGSLPLHVLPPKVQQLFARAFSQESMTSRPGAEEWVAALQEMSGSLMLCSRNSGHQYPGQAGSCPWCAMESATGGMLFRPADPAKRGASAGAGGSADTARSSAPDPVSGFHLAGVWAQVQRVPVPAPARTLPEPATLPAQLSVPVAAYLRRRRWRAALSLTSLAAGAGVWIFLPGYWLMTVGILAGFNLLLLAAGRGRRKLRGARAEERDLLRTRWDEVCRRYAEASGSGAYASKLQELEQAKREYLDLESFKASEMRRLEARQRLLQLQTYLRRNRLEDAQLDGIGPGRRATLALFGIETAWEVDAARLARVPGFGPSNTRLLLAWRERIERRFAFDPTAGRVPQAEILAVERAVEARTRGLERRLLIGASELARISADIRARQEAALREIGGTALELAQAERDLEAL